LLDAQFLELYRDLFIIDKQNKPLFEISPDLISVHDHDYLDLSSFLKRLQREGPDNLRPEKTVFVFSALAAQCIGRIKPDQMRGIELDPLVRF
jgi:hypothetical protein